MAVVVPVLALLVGATAACSSQRSGGDDHRPLVLTTFTVIADMARQVAGDDLRVASITQPGDEIHDFEPSPADIRHGSEAALILDNGLGLERWFERFVQDSPARRVTLSEGIEPIAIRVGPYSGRPNPHAWMSPDGGAHYVQRIGEAFAELDPAHAAAYRERASTYAAAVRTVGAELRADLRGVPAARRTLVTCEGAFSYLTRDLGLSEAYIWPVNSDDEGTPEQIRGVVDQVRADRIPSVFCESTVNDGAMRQVSSETGARYGGELYVDSLSTADGEAPNYLSLLRHDARLIAAGLREGDR